MSDPQPCPHCGAITVADSDRPHIVVGPLYKTLEPRWATLAGSATYSGLSRGLLSLAAKEGRFRSALVKRGDDKKRGRRLVDLRSLEAWIEEGIGL